MPKAGFILLALAVLAPPVRADGPRPVVEAATPSSPSAGGPDFILRVRGSGFSAQSVVRWNGAERVTAQIAPDLLSAMILASDVGKAGEAHVTVFDPAAGLSAPLVVQVRPPAPGSQARRQANPVPVILALEPPGLAVGARAARVQVRGMGFVPLSVVRLRGAPRHTRFVSSTTLSAELLPEDLAQSGNAALSVRNPLPGGGVSIPKLLAVEASAVSSLEQPRVFPNPWRSDADEGTHVAFENLALRSMIKIFTVSGALIKTLAADDGSAEWDLTDHAGLPVAGGSYVYLITDGRKTVEGKLRVSR